MSGNQEMIPVARPYLPNREKLDAYIDAIYERNVLTNNGPLVQELTRRLREHLGVEHLLLVGSGTQALQVAYRVLGVSGSHRDSPASEAVTTPLSFVATASSLKWEGVEPVFADVDAETWCLDPASIEAAIGPRTRALVPVHLFGNACDVDAINDIARDHGIKVIYDGAHAFGVGYRGRSLLSDGDATTVSFHATKAFHTLEGGGIVFRRGEDLARARRMIHFGIGGSGAIEDVGINAKMDEFQAAVGLCVLDEIDECLRLRREAWDAYKAELGGRVQLQRPNPGMDNTSYVYFPVAFATCEQMHQVNDALHRAGIAARRYFFPALDTVAVLNGSRPRSARARDLASRMLCLPLGSGRSETATVLEVLRQVLPRHSPAGGTEGIPAG